MNLFISCMPGLEPILCQELARLGFAGDPDRAGVHVSIAEFKDIYKLNLELRTASRVLLPLLQFECHDKKELYENALEINWDPYFAGNPTFAIDAVVHHNPAITNSLFAAQTVKDAICDQLKKRSGVRPSVDLKDPKVCLHLFIQANRAQISFDTSGMPLHMRGYRMDTGEAPLRQSLAAALLLMLGYTGSEQLVDPCCGTATFLIEAALIASNTAPGLLRPWFGFFSHPEFSEELFRKVKNECLKKKKPLERGQILGIERNPKVVSIAKKAIGRAHFEKVIEVVEGNFQTCPLAFEPDFVIANPPYGMRLEATDSLRQMYQDLGDFLKKRTKKPARAGILTGNLELAKCIGLKTTKRHIVSNGGIDCRLLEYDVYQQTTRS